MHEALTTHLDLGCGSKPRNPLNRDKLYGVDLRSGLTGNNAEEIRSANLSLEPIPFPDNSFNSVSAFDFIEHIPRILPCERGTRFPFVELMNEIWRVLAPNGIFYAVTPAYPNSQVFQDPTHVNIITIDTYLYFKENPWGKMYGFNGAFAIERNEWVLPYDWYENSMSWKKSYRRFYRGLIKGELSHILWQFRAIK